MLIQDVTDGDWVLAVALLDASPRAYVGCDLISVHTATYLLTALGLVFPHTVMSSDATLSLIESMAWAPLHGPRRLSVMRP